MHLGIIQDIGGVVVELEHLASLEFLESPWSLWGAEGSP